MKKTLLALGAALALSINSICLAADGNDLNKQQAAAESFINAFGSKATAYTDLSKNLDKNLKSKITDKTYAQLQKQVKDKFGSLKESKFYSYQRFDQADRITYIASFSKEKIVAVTMSFTKTGKLADFALSPVKQNQPAKK